ncbi:acetyl-CoA carboxylase biotin carboxylase subunit [Caminibacter mediatlanticus]|uniref:Biotin carboxylase-like protein n=1 Tax=Caminibacter mediatlanticus TB-2 TaxID=391592 RepID=A0AAI9AHN3_9BACT|nr:acetyl-CoA carboxylase biotin carboxylase subunit [Caminibacter mediatlanticus]EDM23785.1 Biotin carboxylase-like protein [Caminibacter mediatlanticus TB-2]
MKIKKILIANRGEIALRIIRACKEMGITSVAIFSEPDLNGLWVRRADEAYPILGDPIKAYLDYERIIDIAKKAGVDAIHPGYGFLSENGDFARACERAGIKFIGPRADDIDLYGDKMASKTAMKKVGMPVLEGTEEPIIDIKEAEKIAKQIGFPVIIKAAFGGGGRGMRIVRSEEEFKELFEAATSESMKFFGRGEVFIEKYVENPRHIEVQILADTHGNVIHLGIRDCSIQRRHQKVIEIAESPSLSKDTRDKICEVSVNALKKLGYVSAGTVEFLVDENENFYFIEMNTRVQVEHPVSEVVSGVDIIQEMIRVAEGEKLSITQDDVNIRGFAIEFRLNSEDPTKNFMPTTGTIKNLMLPGGIGIRNDNALYEGYKLPTNYDSMIGKLIVYGKDWEDTVNKARRALDELNIGGVVTNIPLHRAVIRDEDFIKGKFTTKYLDEKLEKLDIKNEDIFEKEEAKAKFLKELVDELKKQ